MTLGRRNELHLCNHDATGACDLLAIRFLTGLLDAIIAHCLGMVCSPGIWHQS